MEEVEKGSRPKLNFSLFVHLAFLPTTLEGGDLKMQTNSQSRRDCVESKAVSVHDNPNAKPDCRGLRAEAHPVDEAAPAEVMKSFTAGVVTELSLIHI